MNSFSPASQGLRLTFRRPTIAVGELVWRWSFAAATLTLLWLFLREYLASLPVTRVDRLLLGSQQPILISRAIHRIFSGSAFRFAEAGVLLAIGLVIAWIALASLGRAATVSAILEEFGFGVPAGSPFAALGFLNFLRAAVTLAAISTGIGAIFISSSFWSATHISVEAASRLFFLAVFLAWFTWSVLNWFLSLSAIFVVSESASAMAAMAEAVRLFQRRPGAVLTTGLLFGLMHVSAFITASAAAFMTLGMLGQISPALAWVSQLFLIAAYCAVADFLYTARMAAYIFIMRGAEPEPVLPVAAPPPVAPTAYSIDRDELILSDVPVPAT